MSFVLDTPTEQLIVGALIIAESLRKSDWCAGNEFARIQLDAENWIKSLTCGADGAPYEVRRAVVYNFLADLTEARRQLASLRKYGDYWGFYYAGMFHGVESDGYIHT